MAVGLQLQNAMTMSPETLQVIATKWIVRNLSDVCTERCSLDDNSLRLFFRDENVFCHPKLADLLLKTLDREGLLDDFTLTLFDPKVCRLNQVTLQKSKRLSCKGLRQLRCHQLHAVEAKGMTKVTVNELISCFSEWTINNLQVLNVSGSQFHMSPMGFRSKGSVVSPLLYVGISKLRNLHVLNVSDTEIVTHALLNICNDLPLLTTLDISNCSRIESVDCLRLRKDTLRALNLYNLKVLHKSETSLVLLDLKGLIHLDVSEYKGTQDHVDRFIKAKPVVPELLRHPEFGPNLRSIDISGQDEVKLEDLHFFVKKHPKLEFLGLMLTSLCLDTVFLDGCNILVSGGETEEQLIEALKRYGSRKDFVQRILYKLFTRTNHFGSPRPEIIRLVLPVMNQHMSYLTIQLAGTACLYNLTKGSMGESVHPHILRDVVHTTLTAMDNFRSHPQLQKNALLTLCCDRILHEVSFDKYWCARLVLDCLLTFDDPSTDRMAVAICSILAAKISTSQTALLGAKNEYMRKLLSIVQRRMDEGTVDITMKFTLSALWNLTDESPATCKVFLTENGLELFLKVLQAFPKDCAVETKVLGLLNNIAEVSPLRMALINDNFISQLRTLLSSEHVDVSYFAAGIVAHLVSASKDCWNAPRISREDLLNLLGEVVSSWEQPKEEMVAYRSFQPFLPLLTCVQMYQVQLWAVWALHHVTTKNSKRYCPMLVQEGVNEVLHRLLDVPATNFKVRELASKVLDVLQQDGYLCKNKETHRGL